MVQHEKYAKHKRALQIRAASNAEQSTECHGTIVRGAKNEQLLGKVFCSLCEHWPHHGGQLGTFITTHFKAANDNSTEIVCFYVRAGSRCTGVCEPGGGSCGPCRKLRTDFKLACVIVLTRVGFDVVICLEYELDGDEDYQIICF